MSYRFPPEITTSRLTLRHWVEADIAAMALAITESLPNLQAWIDAFNTEPETDEQRRLRIQRWQTGWEAGGDSLYGTFHEGSVVGGCGLHRRVGPRAIEIGYWVHSDHQGRGFATEATLALTDTAFGDPSIDTIEVHHDRANAASGAVARNAGFVFQQENPDRVRAPLGDGVDWCWVMTRQAWIESNS
jgi:ribosomal-protein-serine acetyltransferase